MLNLLINNISRMRQNCHHSRVLATEKECFCPDCGCEIKISWNILRCSCCNSKRKSVLSKKVLIPEEKFCKKCGNSGFYIEKKENPEFFDYEYANILKEEIPQNTKIKKKIQIWIDDEAMPEVLSKQAFLPVC